MSQSNNNASNSTKIKACQLTGLNPEVLVATGEALAFDDFMLFLKHKKEYYHDFFRGSKVEIGGVWCDIIARLGDPISEISRWFTELSRIRREELQVFSEEILNIDKLNIFERLATDYPHETIAYQVAIGFDWKTANEIYIKFSKQKLAEMLARVDEAKLISPEVHQKAKAHYELCNAQLEQYIENLAK